MKTKSFLYTLFLTAASVCAYAQNYTITWQRTIGGDSTDKLIRAIKTFDGGTMLCGFSNSNKSGNKKQKSINNTYDYWLVKLSSTDQIEWSQTYGGKDRDLYPNIIQTKDSGYLLAGSSISKISGIKSEDPVNGSFDYWVLKLDKNGNKIWDNTVGGIQAEKLTDVIESTNGYFICGSSNSTYGYDKTLENEGSSLWPDYWVVKLNKSGVLLWDSTYGSKNRDKLTAVKATADGGLLLGGSSYSPRFGNKYDDFLGNNDFWILKLDSLGRPQFNKTIGGRLSDYLTAIDTVGTIGYIIAGYSNSPISFNKSDSCRGVMDYWIIRTDKFGNVLWNKTYGGSGADYATSVKFTNNIFLVGGYSNSNISGDKTSNTKGGMDFWTLKLDRFGSLLEQNDWGGTGDDYLVDYFPVGTEYMLAGSSTSPKGKDKKAQTSGKTGKSDYWVFRIAPSGALSNTKTTSVPVASQLKTVDEKGKVLFQVTPNPVKNTLYINYGGVTGSKITISVYSSGGKLISFQTIASKSGTYSLDMSANAGGVYYAVLQDGTSSVTKKFVKD